MKLGIPIAFCLATLVFGFTSKSVEGLNGSASISDVYFEIDASELAEGEDVTSMVVRTLEICKEKEKMAYLSHLDSVDTLLHGRQNLMK